ncbi:hypothetical protein IUD25_04680 [Xylella fastidiosa subsp. fastidiosa]|uniref:hypothetical protein n=1 Tax=Xylella fastidiosa TaxID=2371 RepID=UPI001892CF7B|nr:hypothetical protein [Xylella fastidiosa]QPC05146.1 hypothetical protein IUD25_04680 [Xylella fastidiosa subsp. fastidiosa]QPC07298.1 hypothetical protein IUD22_04705 [Xylella fastidiosa subsp. fastidiosa]QPC09523.1 hypothetical protein IUD21_05035 [Xylella fastidiosa subsp. fastidiosa]
MTMTQKEDNAEIINEQRIQIAKLISETAKIQAEIHEVTAHTQEMTAHTQKLIKETLKVSKESKWYPIVVASGLMAAGATAATLFIKLFH